MTIGELRNILSGFPAEGEVKLLLDGEQDSVLFADITETMYDVDCKYITLKGYDN